MTYFTLDYPNLEVRLSFSQGLLEHTGLDSSRVMKDGRALLELLVANDFHGFREALHAYIAGIPHQWYDASGIEVYEAQYASMLYLAFQVNGAELVAKDSTSHGRSDRVVFRRG